MDIDIKTASSRKLAAERQRQAALALLFGRPDGVKHTQNVDTIDAELARRDAILATVGAAMEEAWGLIANANGGDWPSASPEWRDAAEKWRDNRWHPFLSAYRAAEGGGT